MFQALTSIALFMNCLINVRIINLIRIDEFVKVSGNIIRDLTRNDGNSKIKVFYEFIRVHFYKIMQTGNNYE